MRTQTLFSSISAGKTLWYALVGLVFVASAAFTVALRNSESNSPPSLTPTTHGETAVDVSSRIYRINQSHKESFEGSRIEEEEGSLSSTRQERQFALALDTPTISLRISVSGTSNHKESSKRRSMKANATESFENKADGSFVIPEDEENGEEENPGSMFASLSLVSYPPGLFYISILLWFIAITTLEYKRRSLRHFPR